MNTEDTSAAVEPTLLKQEDVPAARRTLLTASLYGASRSWRIYLLLLVIVVGSLLAASTNMYGYVWLYLALLGAVVVAWAVLPWFIIRTHMGSEKRRIWALPGGRAVVAAKEIPAGWLASNASARPVKKNLADPLFRGLIHQADREGTRVEAIAANRFLAENYYQKKFGFTIGKARRLRGGIHMFRDPQPNEEAAASVKE